MRPTRRDSANQTDANAPPAHILQPPVLWAAASLLLLLHCHCNPPALLGTTTTPAPYAPRQATDATEKARLLHALAQAPETAKIVNTLQYALTQQVRAWAQP